MKILSRALLCLLLTVFCVSAPSQTPAPKTIATSFDDQLVRANLLFKEGKLDDALVAVEAARKIDTNRFEATATAALILHAAKKPTEAQSALAAALKLVPPEKREKVQAIAKLLGEAGNTSTTVTNAPSPKLTSPARRQLDTLMLIIEEADKAKLADERNKLLAEFLDKSSPFLKENPDHLPVWILCAVASLELNLQAEGWRAGKQLSRLGADKSEDPKVRKVMAMLDRRGMLGDSPPKQREIEESRVAAKQGDLTATRSLESEQRFEKQRTMSAEAFLAANAKKEGVKVTASGLQYKVLKSGKGNKSPKATDTVKVHYHGTLIDGTVVDSSVDRGEPISFPLNGVILGWTEGLQIMKQGDKFQFIIPSKLAYGEKGAGEKIGPNSTLIFDVELLAIERAK